MYEVDTESEEYKRAKARVEELKAFWTHFAVFIIVNGFLTMLDLVTGGGWWIIWVWFGWGVGLAIHAFVVFGASGFLGRDWEEQKIRELMNRGEKPKRG